jgi:hypothetical protein
VELDTLDSFLAREHISVIHILKIDVEGCEFLLLKGAEKTLDRVERIVMECTKAREFQVTELLQNSGFKQVLAIPKYNILYFSR